MGCTGIHDCGRSTYCLALALYKIQFEEIWYYEITNIVVELKAFGRRIMWINIFFVALILLINGVFIKALADDDDVKIPK